MNNDNGILICGVDEAGRGPLCGPVVAAAVILAYQHDIKGLDDSKRLSEAKRLRLAAQIREQAVAWCVAEASPEEIDSLNILQASLLAMWRAVKGLGIQPTKILVDGNRCPDRLPCPAQAIVQGDRLIAEISAASILAKTSRDAHMVSLAKQYPQYGFERHKGYPTKAHLQAMAQYGLLPCYRKSFSPVRILLQNKGTKL